jgi:FkbM family methyltransferase
MQFFKDRLNGTFLYRPLKALWGWRSHRFRQWQNYQHYWRMRRFYAQFIQPGDLAFDVGANMGNRTRVFLDLGANVVAVEPQKECARALFIKFHNNPRFHLVNKALGATEGKSEMFISNFTQTSSLSQEWVQTQKPDELQGVKWDESRTVSVTTLDSLIREYGMPAFAKIDVEGFENEIMRGLSYPLRALSFEFILYYLKPALQSIEHLAHFGSIAFNYAFGERFQWMLDNWVPPDEMISTLKQQQINPKLTSGDVYARLEKTP